jgi:glycosyltransferase involved in cell wall biosynthesis
MNKNDTVLFYFTSEYPFGMSETYVENELIVLAEKFEKIILLPLNGKGVSRKLPKENIESVCLFENQIKIKFLFLLKNLYSFISVLLFEFYHTNRKKSFLLMLPELKSRLLQNMYRAEIFRNYFQFNNKKNFYYSFWTDDWATTLSLLKKKKYILGFISRVHGFDLYEERRPNLIIPFRYFQLKNVKKIYAVSKDGLGYMCSHYPENKHKFFLSHLNVFDLGDNPWSENNDFTIVSCSNLIPLKRVNLIIETLKHFQFNLHWIHFGDGELRYSLEREAEKLPVNIKYEFKGSVTNADLITFYKNNTVNLFIHLSETEGGVPLALQEAASLGIPLLGTNVGGVCEIVSEQTGFLVDKNSNAKTLSELITKFRYSDKNTPDFRRAVKAYWKAGFDAQKNYEDLFLKFINLH